MKDINNYIQWTKINHDVNGNPRYVCHYLAFKPYQDSMKPYQSFEYHEALMI